MKHLLAFLLLLSPTLALAATAGTDGYLREIGYTDSQLENEVVTEKREAFLLVEGQGLASDPVGDVLGRFGTTSKLLQPWGDLSGATMTKNEEAQTWDIAITLGGALPDVPTVSAQVFLFMDTDGDASDNAREGIRIGTDAEFSVKHSETGWTTDFRWYNPDAQFWATNKKTAMTFETGADSFVLHVPFAEAAGSLAPHWRVVMALADSANTQIDVVPGTGFPPPIGETYPEARTGAAIPDWAVWLVLTAILAAGVRYGVAKKRQKE